MTTFAPPPEPAPTAHDVRQGIPVGLATQLGGLGTLVLAVVALVTAVLNGDHTPETISALAGAVIILATTVIGRMNQAAAVYRANPTVTGALEAADVVRAPLPPEVR